MTVWLGKTFIFPQNCFLVPSVAVEIIDIILILYASHVACVFSLVICRIFSLSPVFEYFVKMSIHVGLCFESAISTYKAMSFSSENFSLSSLYTHINEYYFTFKLLVIYNTEMLYVYRYMNNLYMCICFMYIYIYIYIYTYFDILPQKIRIFFYITIIPFQHTFEN